LYQSKKSRPKPLACRIEHGTDFSRLRAGVHLSQHLELVLGRERPSPGAFNELGIRARGDEVVPLLPFC